MNTQPQTPSVDITSTQDGGRVLSQLDRIGTFMSTACAIHCILVPLLITVLPLLGLGFIAEHRFEAIMLIFTVSLASLSLCWGTRIHGKKHTLIFLLAAILFFISAHGMAEREHWWLMALGGLCLASGHILNRKLCKSCHECSCSH